MVRTINEQEYAQKRNAILDAVSRLLYRKGYEQMTIQDIVDDLQLSKGAFYHYFDSKQALLEALVQRLLDQMEEGFLLPLMHNAELSALDKLQRFFDTLNQGKLAQKDVLLALLRVWYTDDNAIVRQKLQIAGTKRALPLLTQILRQGREEGILAVNSPEQVAEVVLVLLRGLQTALDQLLLQAVTERDILPGVQRIIAVYTDALERILGVPSGSLLLASPQTLSEWFVSPPLHEQDHA